jgi:hypothetical protein
VSALLKPFARRHEPAETVYNYNKDRGNQLQRQFDVVIERDEDGYYVASIPQIPGCHTQALSLEEVMQRIREAAELCLDVPGVRVTCR